MPNRITLFSLFLFFIFIAAAYADDDTLTISTYYPSPFGVYNRLQTNSLGVGDNNNNGVLDSGDVPPATRGATNGDVWIAGNVGIGIGATAPTAGLDVNGNVRIRGGGPGANKVLTSDDNGLATWQSANSTTNIVICPASDPPCTGREAVCQSYCGMFDLNFDTVTDLYRGSSKTCWSYGGIDSAWVIGSASTGCHCKCK